MYGEIPAWELCKWEALADGSGMTEPHSSSWAEFPNIPSKGQIPI